ncbi:lactococcin 972 family bacteriocin [Streptomyces sp. NPDC001978]|uniref:lactococcin 972 family bacteriocin n=1 Tax=Streptomyces sp. NPDC001978 TaxID=3364627 RepID=UPI0036BA6656
MLHPRSGGHHRRTGRATALRRRNRTISIPSVSPTSEACVPASGGNWCYGDYLTTSGKYCYSNYHHYTKVHKSSVKIAGVTVSSGWVAANDYSNAHRTAGAAYTCYTYYSIQ